jgi:hypothetical protein
MIDTTRNVAIKLSKCQAEDLWYKLDIVRNEQDLLDDYGLSAVDLDRLISGIPMAGGEFLFQDRFLPMIREEAENLANCAYDPWAMGITDQSGEYHSASNLERKLENVK